MGLSLSLHSVKDTENEAANSVSLTLTAKGLVKIQIGSPSETTLQRSKLTFLKSRLFATFNYKMVAIKKILVTKKKLISIGNHMISSAIWNK